ncbi:MAG TPA: flagellar motor switch protein FliN [Bryobacteraceae bacterium]|nr:flagellar motor switch protein FliN [Bryobacteraceae bacterium]
MASDTSGPGWLFEQWGAKLAQSLGAMLGEEPRVTVGPEAAPTPTEGLLWWRETLNLFPEPCIWVGAPEASWRQIGNAVLVSAGIEDADDENIKSTYQEIVSQSLAGLSQALSSRLRREVSRKEVLDSDPPSLPSRVIQVYLGETHTPLYLALAQKLLQFFEEPAEKLAPEPLVSTKDAGVETDSIGPTRAYPRGLDLLLDVELPVAVSFGRAQLPIKDVIKLTTGSIVELNRSVAEPVEVIVNNIVIARGEVVVVEGNFGIRIKQIISRKERLRTLR